MQCNKTYYTFFVKISLFLSHLILSSFSRLLFVVTTIHFRSRWDRRYCSHTPFDDEKQQQHHRCRVRTTFILFALVQIIPTHINFVYSSQCGCIQILLLPYATYNTAGFSVFCSISECSSVLSHLFTPSPSLSFSLFCLNILIFIGFYFLHLHFEAVCLHMSAGRLGRKTETLRSPIISQFVHHLMQKKLHSLTRLRYCDWMVVCLRSVWFW